VPPARRSLSLARRIVTEGRDPASRFRDLRGSVRAAHRAWSAWRTRPPRKSERASSAHPTPRVAFRRSHTTSDRQIRRSRCFNRKMQGCPRKSPHSIPMSRRPRLRNPAGFEFGHDAEIRANEAAPEFRYFAGLKAVSSQAILRRGPCRKRQAGLHSAARPRTSGRSVRACIQPTRSRSALARS
jgi:hypothetical protein